MEIQETDDQPLTGLTVNALRCKRCKKRIEESFSKPSKCNDYYCWKCWQKVQAMEDD